MGGDPALHDRVINGMAVEKPSGLKGLFKATGRRPRAYDGPEPPLLLDPKDFASTYVSNAALVTLALDGGDVKTLLQLSGPLEPMRFKDGSTSFARRFVTKNGSSTLLSVQLEDWLEMDQPVNIPGTVDEYPNWRRKLSMNLDEVFAHAGVNRIAHKLTEVRAKVSK